MTRRWPFIVVAPLCCLLALATAASAEEPKGFLEWQWGTPQQTMAKRFPASAQCLWTAKWGTCNKYYVGDIQIVTLMLSFQPNDTLSGYAMYFAPDSYPQMRATIIEKFGPPTNIKSTTPNESLSWEWPSGTGASLRQTCEKFWESCFTVWTNAMAEWLPKEEEMLRERRKKAF